jgi:hypothetical protein
MLKAIATGLGVVGMSLSVAIPAHADDQGFIDYIHSHGVSGFGTSDDFILNTGKKMCRDWRDDIRPTIHWSLVSHLADLSDAAHSQLCPDVRWPRN